MTKTKVVIRGNEFTIIEPGVANMPNPDWWFDSIVNSSVVQFEDERGRDVIIGPDLMGEALIVIGKDE